MPLSLQTEPLHRHLPHPESVARPIRSYPNNKILSGRVDTRSLLGANDPRVLGGVLHCNTTPERPIQLPVFDKSLHADEGDRSTHAVSIQAVIELFILEGWSIGFQPLDEDEHSQRYTDSLAKKASPSPAELDHSVESLFQINTYLSTVAQTLYPPFRILIQIRPESYDYVYAWRKEQEHAMIALRVRE